MSDAATSSGRGPHLSLPRWELIARAIDEASGNPFQQIHAVYWAVSASSIAGALDSVRTALTELFAELGALMPAGQSTPTADQVATALHVAVSGGSPQFTITAPVSTVTASTGATIDGAVAGGQTGVAGRDLQQSATYDVSRQESVSSWLEEFQAALTEFDDALRPVVQQQLEQVAEEIESEEPREVVVRGLLGSLRSFAENAVAAAGAGAGTMGLAEVLAHWPL